jgi:hypothetical protein
MPKTAIETNTKTRTSSTQQPRPRTMSPDPEAQHPTAIIQRARAAPESLTRADVLQLQGTVGNQAVGRLLAGIGRPPSAGQKAPVQRQPELEEEELLQGKFIEAVQRQEIPEDEELLQVKMIETVQRQPEPDEEELLQGNFTNECVQCQIPEEKDEEMQEKGLTLQAKEEAPPNRTGMPDHLKSGLENLSGMDLSGVRVQYSSSKPKQLNALAYTQGHEIHVAPGQEKHLPHEGWHAVQQMQGRVRPTGKLGAMPLNDSRTLESEADSMGRKALQQYAQVGKPKENKSREAANSIVQNKSDGKQGFGFIDNRPEAVKQKKIKNHIKERFNNLLIQRRVLSSTGKIKVGAVQPIQLYNIGGAELSWLPKTTGEVKRYATAEEKIQLDSYDGNYRYVKHKNSDRNAVWFSDTGKEYKADFASDRPYIFATSLNERDYSNFINSENVPTFEGEAQHPDKIIVKENERGAYGIGRNIIDGKSITVTPNQVKKKKKKHRR